MRNPSRTLTPAAALALAAGLMATPALAQQTPSTAPATAPATATDGEVAAARLPNAFDGPPRPVAPFAPVAARATPSAEAPDVARGRETLEAVIADAGDGRLDFSVFSDDVAARLRPVEADLTATIQGFGALQAISHAGHQNGADMFEVRFDTVVTQWVIGFDGDDRIAVLLFREAPPAEAAPAAPTGN